MGLGNAALARYTSRLPRKGPSMAETVEELRLRWSRRKAALVAYLANKTESEDWHAVQDAASDIREAEAMMEALALILEAQA